MNGPTSKPPPVGALRTGTRLSKGMVIGFIQDSLDPTQEIVVCTWPQELIDHHLWVLPLIQEILTKMAQGMMAEMGMTSEVVQRHRPEGEQIGEALPPKAESLIILDPIEEARRRKS